MKKLLFASASLLLFGSAIAQTSSFFEKTCYRGAFAPSPAPMWTDTWTEWSPKTKVYPAPTVTISSNISTNTTWVAGQTYLLQGPIYITNNSILTIPAGVVVLGDKSSSGAALIVTKGSQLIANGTVSQPIVFTSNQAPGARSLGDWGGIIILGKAANNNSNGLANIEGLPISANSEHGGGTSVDDNDNSGSLKYVRIEFGGYVYQPNQEINGLTMGSVGRGTTIDYVQVSYVNDDAFEWFGGTVNCKHLVSYRNLDDDFDTDLGYKGYVQYGLALRDPDLADVPAVSTSEFFESDNDATGSAATPKTAPIFSNITCIGALRGSLTATAQSGHQNRVRLRRNSEQKIFNSIFTDQVTRGLFIDGTAAENNANNGLLKFKNNIIGGYAVRATQQGTTVINTNTFVIANANDTLGKTVNAGNLLVSPFNWTSPDYRPSAGSLALSNASFTDVALSANASTVAPVVAANIPSVSCIGSSTANISPITLAPFSTVSPNYCSLVWTADAGVVISSSTAIAPTCTISTLGTFGFTLTVINENGTTAIPLSITTTTCADVSVKEIGLLSGVSVFPNPATENTSIKFYSAAATDVQVTVSDITGKNVLSVINSGSIAGSNEISIPSSELQSGVYFVTIFTGTSKETVKLIVNH